MTLVSDAVRLAAGTLTVLPVRPPRSIGGPVAGLAMVLAPLVVLPLAALAGLVLWAPDEQPLLAACLAVAVLAVGSGILHLDGLADTADGLVVQGDRVRRLDVMRRGDVGPAGVVALLLVLLVQVAALIDVPPLGLVVAVCASRAVLPIACARGIPAARMDGLGSAVAGSVPTLVAPLPLVVVGVIAALVDGWPGVAGALAALAAAVAVLAHAARRLGGVTGDVLGACVELALAAYLVGYVACL